MLAFFHAEFPTGCTLLKCEDAIPGTISAQTKEGVEVKTLLVIIIGFLPSLFSLWLMRKTQARTRSQFRRAAMSSPARRIRQNTISEPGDRYYLEGVGYLIGDISCQFNARSGYLRCAVNPSGPCEGCRYYQPRETVCSENSSSDLPY